MQKKCFIETAEDTDPYKVLFKFMNNKALTRWSSGGSCNSIHAITFLPCCQKHNKNSIEEVFEKVGKFDFSPNNINQEVSTLLSHSLINGSNVSMFPIIPGKPTRLPIEPKNDFNMTIPYPYSIQVVEKDSSEYSLAGTYFLTLKGEPGEEVSIHLTTLSSLRVVISFIAKLQNCPPGHIYDKESEYCVCDTSNFRGIWKCDIVNKIASIINGHWFGLCKDSQQCTGYCPLGFCTNNLSTDLTKSINETYKLICDTDRKGTLCGKCSDNHSVYYNSAKYHCGGESNCNYGILFYILSEILPLTIIFIVIITFNISFTTGAVNGIIFYAQVYSIFVYRTLALQIPSKMIDVSEMLYTMTNLNYFNLEALSFCLWKGAGTLDIIAWKYVTIVYALFIIIVVYSMNTTTLKKICKCWRPKKHKDAVIHGLTTFLVMCYSQCTTVTFLLFYNTDLIGHDHTVLKSVVFFSGELEYFSRRHLSYILPAMIFLLLIVIAPPILLIMYPLGFKLLALCKLSELRMVTRAANIIPVQLFDSLQSCFKDKFRFFSGLYFFYRVFPQFLFALSKSFMNFYLSAEIFLIIVLAVHAIVQPYKQHWHNIIDTLLFTDLAIINAISLYNYHLVNEMKKNYHDLLVVTTSIQIIFICLPLFFIFSTTLWLLFKWIKKKLTERKISQMDYNQEILLDSINLPPLRQENLDTESHEYHNMK